MRRKVFTSRCCATVRATWIAKILKSKPTSTFLTSSHTEESNFENIRCAMALTPLPKHSQKTAHWHFSSVTTLEGVLFRFRKTYIKKTLQSPHFSSVTTLQGVLFRFFCCCLACAPILQTCSCAYSTPDPDTACALPP